MEFLCYHRDRPASLPLRYELREEHWSYMDQYAKEMIARGPTLADDGDTPTGSVHIVDLPDPAAARTFAFDEPNYQAGVYRDVLLRRWRNTLGRTMWDFPGGRTDGNRYLVIGLGAGQAADLAVPPDPGKGPGGVLDARSCADAAVSAADVMAGACARTPTGSPPARRSARGGGLVRAGG